MLEWNVFGRGFDSRRLHQILPPAKFGVLSLPKGPIGFYIASGEIWCPELACGELAESVEGQKLS
jgi:hypothetical protein